MKLIIDQNTMTREQQYNYAYMNMAYCIAELSYAVRAKVGCILVSESGQILSHGWNGTPTGFDNNCEYWDDKLQRLVTKPEVLHAESNAILKCAKSTSTTNNATLYVTLMPCIDCAKMIIQAGIKKVYYHEDYRDNTGVKFLIKNNIQVKKI